MKNHKTKSNTLKKIIISFILLMSVFAIFAPLAFSGPNNELAPSTAFAAAGDDDKKTAPPSDSPKFQELMNDTVDVLNLFIKFLQRLLWPVLLLIGGLLKNDILFGSGMEEVMLTIWRNIRNIVNILFVLLLLGIAFYNVMGGSQQDYHIKAILPKFIIALIAVNFSFLMVKVVIDGVSVVTTAIFALPSTVEQQLKSKDPSKDLAKNKEWVKSVCEGLYGRGTEYEPPKDDSALCKSKEYAFTDEGKLFFNGFDSNSAAVILAMNLGEVGKIEIVKIRSAGTAVKDMFLNSLFTGTIFIVYATAFLALLIILAVRLVVLWVTMVLSPLIVLAFVVPENLKSSLGGSGELGKKFIKNAIAPIPIALMMSIGWIMLNAWKNARYTSGTFGAETAGLNLLTSGLTTLQDFIAMIGMVVVIWMGVFEAAKDTYAEGIVGGLKGAVEKAGKFVVTAPFKYLPLVPVKAGEKPVSVGAITGALGQIPGKIRDKHKGEQERVLDHLGLGGTTQAKKDIEDAKSYKDLRKASAQHASTWYKDKDRLRDMGKKLKEKTAWRRQFFAEFPSGITDSKGEKWDHEKIVTAMAAGTLPHEIGKQIADAHKEKEGSSPLGTGRGSEVKGEKGAAGAAGTAGAVVGGKSYLSAAQNKAQQNASMGNEPADEAEREALKQATAIKTAYEEEFLDGIRDPKASADKKVQVISTAKTKLTEIIKDEKQVEAILAPEVQGLYDQYKKERATTTDNDEKERLGLLMTALKDTKLVKTDEGTPAAGTPPKK